MVSPARCRVSADYREVLRWWDSSYVLRDSSLGSRLWIYSDTRRRDEKFDAKRVEVGEVLYRWSVAPGEGEVDQSQAETQAE